MRARIITGALFGAIFLGTFFLSSIIFSLMLLGILIIILATEWPRFFSYKKISFWLITPWYPLMPFCLLMLLNSHADYRHLVGIIFLTVFTFDTASYFGGKFLGTHKLAPRISPGKTWEGFVCGTLATLAAVIAIVYIENKPFMISKILLVTACIPVLGLVGDLFESWLKRRVGLKDSGSLLPGHGGFLDRFDGILFVTYFFYFARHLLAKLL